jgi:hypothetical protein
LGGLYHENHIIRRIAPNGNVSTFAGSAGLAGSVDGVGTSAKFNGPYFIAIDSTGNLYIPELCNVIRKISPNGFVTAISGSAGAAGSTNGVGSAARFNLPTGIAIDSVGNMFVSEYGNSIVRRLTYNCQYSTFEAAACLSSGFLGSSRNLTSGDITICTALTSQTTTACCYITSQWSAFSICSAQGTSTRTRTGTSACTTELSEIVACCYISDWTNAVN